MGGTPFSELESPNPSWAILFHSPSHILSHISSRNKTIYIYIPTSIIHGFGRSRGYETWWGGGPPWFGLDFPHFQPAEIIAPQLCVVPKILMIEPLWKWWVRQLESWEDEIPNIYGIIWGFLEMGVPSNHLFLGFSITKTNQLFGYPPWLRKSPYMACSNPPDLPSKLWLNDIECMRYYLIWYMVIPPNDIVWILNSKLVDTSYYHIWSFPKKYRGTLTSHGFSHESETLNGWFGG